MDRGELANVTSDVLLPLGFKRKGNYRVVYGSKLDKIVNLQKSQYRNRYYINYGFILNSIPLDGLAHTSRIGCIRWMIVREDEPDFLTCSISTSIFRMKNGQWN